MKRTTTVGIVLIVVILVAVPVVLWEHDRQIQRLTPQEKEAMAYLPGYSFVLDGKRIVIKPKWTHKAFLAQHDMLPFLEQMVPRLKRWKWTKDRPPMEITETKGSIVVTIPRWQQEPLGPYSWSESDFCSQVTFDRETGNVISAWSGR